MIDEQGYRANVGIILTNVQGQSLWARRIGQNAWQFPQGGIQLGESPEQAVYRELWEEVGLLPENVTIIGRTQDWLHYQLPKWLIRHNEQPICIGQKQIWYLLKLTAKEEVIKLNVVDNPEFDHWRWVDYWFPLNEVVEFKRDVYKQALNELAPLLSVLDQ